MLTIASRGPDDGSGARESRSMTAGTLETRFERTAQTPKSQPELLREMPKRESIAPMASIPPASEKDLFIMKRPIKRTRSCQSTRPRVFLEAMVRLVRRTAAPARATMSLGRGVRTKNPTTTARTAKPFFVCQGMKGWSSGSDNVIISGDV